MFILPKSISKRIEKLFTTFLLSGENKSQYMPKVEWKELHVPKDEGGILITTLDTYNQTFIMKHIWNMF